MSCLNSLFRIVVRANRGNVALIVALSLPIVLATLGGAADFSRAVQLRSELQDAADVASIGAIAINSAGYKAGIAMKGDGAIPVGADQAVEMFNSDYHASPDITSVKPAASLNKVGTTLTSTVTVNATYKPYMLSLVGMSSIPLTISSVSTATVPPYVDFYLLLDNTPSMGLGATTADIDTMTKKMGCAFACHEDDLPGTDNYSKSIALKVTLRIDVVRTATQNLMATAKATETLPDQYRMAIYDFGTSANTINLKDPGAYKVSALTSNLDTSTANASTIGLMTIPKQNYNNDSQTNFTSALTAMNTAIADPGSGMTSDTPQKVLFLVTDGVNDGYDCAYSNGATCRRITPIDNTLCTKIKARGIKIAVLYTTYQPVTSDSFFNSWVAKYVAAPSQVATQAEACASSNLYFEVSPSQGISDAMQALFKRIITVVRINS